MTCYFRHLNIVFSEAGITVTPENRKEVDRIIHQLVGVEYKDSQKLGTKLNSDSLMTQTSSCLS